MALTGTAPTLKTAASAAAKAALLAAGGGGDQPWVVDGAELQGLADAIGAAVAETVAHFLSNAVVSPAGVPPMTAPPGGGPVAGLGVLT